VLGFEDIDGRGPGGDAGFVGRTLEGLVEEAADLILERAGTKRFKTY